MAAALLKLLEIDYLATNYISSSYAAPSSSYFNIGLFLVTAAFYVGLEK